MIDEASSNCINVKRKLTEGGNTQQVLIIYVMQEMGHQLEPSFIL